MISLSHISKALAIATIVAAGVCQGADLTLKPFVTAKGSLIRLGDIAQIATDDADEQASLSNLPLMPAPAPGAETTITAQGVRDLIVASGVDLSTLRFTGAIRIEIGHESLPTLKPTQPTFVASSQKPNKTASRQSTGFRSTTRPGTTRRPKVRSLPHNEAKQVTSTLEQRVTEFSIEHTSNPMVQVIDLEVDPRHLSMLSQANSEAAIATTTPVTFGRQRFLVSFDSEFGAVRFPVFANIQPARPAVFTVRDVPRGMLITRADVELRPLPLDYRLRADEAFMESLEEVVGREAARSLRIGTPLTDANCLPPMLVRRGDEVTVIAGGGGIRISMTARAKSNGRLGEIVPVETFDNKEKLTARVVGRRELAMLSLAARLGSSATSARLNGRVQ